MNKKNMVLFFLCLFILMNLNNVKVLGFKEEALNNIVYRPISYEMKEGNFKITKDTVICFNGKNEEEVKELLNIATYIKMKVILPTGFDLNLIRSSNCSENSIYLTTVNSDKLLCDEGYILDIGQDKIKAIANDPEGIFMAVQTLIKMLPAEIEEKKLVEDIEWTIPAAIIEDKPKGGYRGFMLND